MIMFLSNGTLWTVRADGMGARRLDSFAFWPGIHGPIHSTSWSPDGSRIVFSGTRQDTNREPRGLVVTQADGSQKRFLGDGLCQAARWPSWSPGGERIAFVSPRDKSDRSGPRDLRSAICVVNADGSEPAQLADLNLTLSQPAWSPDGSKILFLAQDPRAARMSALFERDLDYSTYLHVMNAHGSGQLQLARVGRSMFGSAASWSPDSRRIAFALGTSSASGESLGICVINADGSGQAQLTRASGMVEQPWRVGDTKLKAIVTDSSPVWSPDGSRIAFVSNRVGNEQIYTIAPDGSGLKRLTRNSGLDVSPAWSRDGSLIAFVSLREFKNYPVYNRDNAVYVMKADGSGQRCVSQAQKPCDSPDIF